MSKKKTRTRASSVALSGEEKDLLWEALENRIEMLEGHDMGGDDDEIQAEILEIVTLQNRLS